MITGLLTALPCNLTFRGCSVQSPSIKYLKSLEPQNPSINGITLMPNVGEIQINEIVSLHSMNAHVIHMIMMM